MSPNTVISKQIIKDHMLANNLKPYTIIIYSSIMKAFRSARMKYEEYLKLENEKKSVSEKRNPGHPDINPILKTYVASVAHLSKSLKCWTQILSSVLRVQRKRMT